MVMMMMMMMIMIIIMIKRVLQNANQFVSEEGEELQDTGEDVAQEKVQKVQNEEATPGINVQKIQAKKSGVIKSTKAEEATRDKSNVCTCLFLLAAGMDQCCHVAKTWPS